MGLLKRLKVLNDPAIKRWQASQEQWAEITWLGTRMGVFIDVRLEIHDSGLPVRTVAEYVHVPLKVTPEVGQHVAFHFAGDGSKERIAIDWDKAPQYGEAQEQAAAAQNLIDQYVPALPVMDIVTAALAATDPQDMDPAVHLQRLEDDRAAGRVSDADYASRRRDLDNWVANLKRLDG